jgi:hypothetical protein
VQAPFDELRRAVRGSNPEAITTAKTQLDQSWRAAVQGFAQRKQAEEAGLAALRATAESDWLVPEIVAQAIRDAAPAEAVQGVAAAVAENDLASAAQRRQRLITALGAAVPAAAVRWQQTVGSVIQLLQTEPGLSKTVKESFGPPAKAAAVSLNRVAVDPLTTLAKIEEALMSVGVERSAVKQLLDGLADIIELEWLNVTQTLNPAPAGWDPAAFEKVGVATKAFRDFLRTIPDRPDLGATAQNLHALHSAWREGVGGQFGGGNKEIQEALSHDDYVAAIKAAAAPHAVPPLEGPALLAGPAARTAALPFPMQSPVALVPPHRVNTFLTIDGAAGPVTWTEAGLARNLWAEKLIQSILLGVIVLAGAYGFNSDSFLGTPADFLTLFFWAFGLDLTVDAVSRITRKLGS